MDKQTYWRSLSSAKRDEMAERLGRKRTYLDRIFLYGKTPGSKLAIQIHEATGGRVPPSELRDDLPDGVFRRRPAAS